MITDPQTSPSRRRSQILYGAEIATAYSGLLMLHVNFTMFYSVTVVCALRGLCLFASSRRASGVVPSDAGETRVQSPDSVGINAGVGNVMALPQARFGEFEQVVGHLGGGHSPPNLAGSGHNDRPAAQA